MFSMHPIPLLGKRKIALTKGKSYIVVFVVPMKLRPFPWLMKSRMLIKSRKHVEMKLVLRKCMKGFLLRLNILSFQKN